MRSKNNCAKSFLIYKISSKLKKPKRNFKDETSFITAISKSELKSSALEDENNGTEESQMMNICLT